MKLFSILTAAAGLLIVSACASTPAQTDERVCVTSEASDIQPGIVYISPDAASIFTLRDADKAEDARHDIETEINESGYLAVRVFGKTEELSALKWAFCGDIEYEFGYQFLWFDADGNRVASDVERLRKTVPGDPVRFVGHAPTEEVRNYAMILKTADECDFSASEDSGVADGEAEASAEKDAETESAEEAETSATEAVIPSLPQENVSGDKQEVKVIGVSGDAPAAVPSDKQ